MPVKKIISVVDLIEKVNHRNRHSTCKRDIREGWNSLLEDVLLANQCYAGFGYLTQEEVPAGQQAGMKRVGEGWDFPDDTRRVYYVHMSLRVKPKKQPAETRRSRPTSELQRDHSKEQV